MARILILRGKPLFEPAPSEASVRELIRALKVSGHEADTLEIPQVLGPDYNSDNTARWASLDLASVGGAPLDLIITTCDGSASVAHPNKLALPATGTWHLNEVIGRVEEALNRRADRG